MPFYEYECNDCCEKWSVLLSMSQRDEIEKTLSCPDCGAKGPRRLLSGFATCKSSAGGPPPRGDCGGGGGGG